MVNNASTVAGGVAYGVRNGGGPPGTLGSGGGGDGGGEGGGVIHMLARSEKVQLLKMMIRIFSSNVSNRKV